MNISLRNSGIFRSILEIPGSRTPKILICKLLMENKIKFQALNSWGWSDEAHSSSGAHRLVEENFKENLVISGTTSQNPQVSNL